MLASITPLGERGRRQRWSVTVAGVALGATAAGGLLGAGLGALGGAATGWLTVRGRLIVLALALLAAALGDRLPARVPGPRRQVDERWLDEFRGWIYGLGFGSQLGLGVTTVVSSAATYAALLGALLSGDPGRGAAIVGTYGALRGLTPLAAARVRAPEQLLSLHARFEQRRAGVSRLAADGLALLAALAAAAVVAT